MCEVIGTANRAISGLTRRKLLLLSAGASLMPLAAACGGSNSNTDSGFGSTETPTIPDVVPPLGEGSSSPTASAAVQSPVATPAKQPTPLLCRQAWGASPTRPGGRKHTLNRMTLHHSAVVFDDNRQIAARLREHQRNHQDVQGWIDIAYHVAVDREGNLFELRPAGLVGDTATNYDPTGHFLVLVEGNFEEQPVAEAQLHGAALAFAWGAQQYGLSTKTLLGHRDIPAATACPGAALEAYITDGRLRERVDAILAQGPVPVQKICGSEAATIVADIEAGVR